MSTRKKTTNDRARKIAGVALARKGEEIVILDMRGVSSVCDDFVLISANSSRTVNAISEHIQDEMKRSGVPALRVEGRHSPYWVLLDYGDVIVHIFYKEMREFYGLERLWSDAPREYVKDNV